MRVFVAGGSGAIGRLLVPMLIEAQHHVTALTRSPERAAALAAMGAVPVVADVYDKAVLAEIVCAAQPDIVVHQLDWRDGFREIFATGT